MEFKELPKIYRLTRECIITEKIDGTNGIIGITGVKPNEASTNHKPVFMKETTPGDGSGFDGGLACIFAGSRNCWIDVHSDNHGFAHWVTEHGDELLKLGAGYHYGEWWGHKIQRGYGLKERRFSLFNVGRWTESGSPGVISPKMQYAPPCCRVVPILFTGMFSEGNIIATLDDLRQRGSIAEPGYMNPEGIVIYHVPSGYLFKKTIEKDDQPKG